MSILTDKIVFGTQPMRVRLCLRSVRHLAGFHGPGFAEEVLRKGKIGSSGFIYVEKSALLDIKRRF